MEIRDGERESCLLDVYFTQIHEGNAINISKATAYDSDSCTYVFFGGAGELSFVLAKDGYDTLLIESIHVAYEDTGCCGIYEGKTVGIRWYKSGLNREPEVTVD